MTGSRGGGSGVSLDMLDFIRDGGPPAILILTFGTILNVFAILFLRQPAVHRLRFVKGLSMATTWTMLGGMASCVRLVLRACAQLPDEAAADMPKILMMGLGEALTIVILGSVFLTIAWFIAAVGMRRLGD
ncbi:MAG: hypothetical protein U1E65_09770 [Myxococcota bacterium]